MITTLLFDVGGTLNQVTNTPELRAAFGGRLKQRLADYDIFINVSGEELGALLHENAEDYKKWSQSSRYELDQASIWNDFYLKQFCIGKDRLSPISEELSFLYDYDRVKIIRRPGLKETMLQLHEMGIRLGIISNIISTSFTPHILKEYGIDSLMECIVMSSEAGARKPDARIFNVAMKQLGVTPQETGYVGDTLSRDVLGAKNAGLGLNILVNNPAIAYRDAHFTKDTAPKPDYTIHSLLELPDIIRSINGR